ncbi:AbrB family transcriptional regulator [Rhodospirillum sp. A1_3_36]|uniref:AbrB family transcriptional regulator n=1 Tax=Rhodospirillum sp. A1_3_36 TaxID=3391666 RepID=UPI0039A6C70B
MSPLLPRAAGPGPRRRLVLSGVRWASLLAAAVGVSLALRLVGLPAAFLLGPMLVGVLFALSGQGPRMPRSCFLFAQGLAGCLIAGNLTPSILGAIAGDWPLLLATVVGTLLFSCLCALVVHRVSGVPMATAVWGSLPGMSGAMVVMAHERGGDVRLVAFMQYVRLASVILAVSLVSHFLGEKTVVLGGAVAPSSVDRSLLLVLAPLALGAIGMAAPLFRWVPAAGMMVPLLVATAFEASGTLHVVPPAWALLAAFIVIGLDVGLKFTRATVVQVLRMTPLVLFSTVLLIGLCGLMAAALSGVLKVSLLTAFLAMAPGSIDSIAIVAVNSHADVSFILAPQTARMFVVVLLAPYIVRWMESLVIWGTAVRARRRARATEVSGGLD